MRVEARAVGRRFGRVTALRGVSFDLDGGRRVALIGPNGAGKSTLTRVVMGMLACTGEILLDGRSPYRDRAELARSLAYVPQVAPQLGATVGEVVAAVSRLRQLDPARIVAAGADLGLDLPALRRRSVRQLSGGMRQKLLLALALASDVSLLILDEPTASLDAWSRQRFFARVAALPRTPTIILCSHRLEEIRHLVDRVIVLADGAVAFDGDAADYLRATGVGVLEVMTGSPRAARWLTDRGFHAGAAGWFSRPLHNGRRLQLLDEVLREIGGELVDVVVRDAERLDSPEDADERR